MMMNFNADKHPRSGKTGEFVKKPVQPGVPPTPNMIPKQKNMQDGVSSAILDDVNVSNLEGKFNKRMLNVPASLNVPSDGERTRVVALRGIPGSGKSTLAKQVIAGASGKAVRINNDDINMMFFGSSFGSGDHVGALLRNVRISLLKAALSNPAVKLIIIDNTNLNMKTLRELEQITHRYNADFIVEDAYLNTNVDVCIARDAARETPVGEAVIRRMHKQASSLKPYAYLPESNVQPYHNNPELPHAVIVDVDGTLAIMGDRKPYDWSLVHLDTPNLPVVNLVKTLIAEGQEVIIMSGRDEVCRDATQKFLDEYVGEGLQLHMRGEKDSRQDYVVKHELFNAHVADKYHVKFVLDDRDQVIQLWRDGLKLPTFQVDYGDF